jgi:hypothetical protein
MWLPVKQHCKVVKVGRLFCLRPRYLAGSFFAAGEWLVKKIILTVLKTHNDRLLLRHFTDIAAKYAVVFYAYIAIFAAQTAGKHFNSKITPVAFTLTFTQKGTEPLPYILTRKSGCHTFRPSISYRIYIMNLPAIF